ncbi:hypothetical protein Cgig2_020580 [Carnegiea gigantea]|uniref:Beta-galactosidase beta-sandwich domain-containing protein n=1 Tax=Carnegiea gigantea TaxID=171969 RepID=A0A9Q1QCY5_9CARY|nr:hypothetical protein Cgig2_020580 [Carnegiea gigantea]
MSILERGSEWKEKAENLELELQQCYKAQSRLLEQLVVEVAKYQAAKASIQEKETAITELQGEYSLLSALGINHGIHFGSHVEIVMQANVHTDSYGIFAAFISNADNKTSAVVEFRNKTYHLLAWSVTILLDCKNVVYNTTKVSLLSMFHCLGETLLLVQIIV